MSAQPWDSAAITICWPGFGSLTDSWTTTSPRYVSTRPKNCRSRSYRRTVNETSRQRHRRGAFTRAHSLQGTSAASALRLPRRLRGGTHGRGGLSKDKTLALYWYQKAARQGHEGARQKMPDWMTWVHRIMGGG